MLLVHTNQQLFVKSKQVTFKQGGYVLIPPRFSCTKSRKIILENKHSQFVLED